MQARKSVLQGQKALGKRAAAAKCDHSVTRGAQADTGKLDRNVVIRSAVSTFTRGRSWQGRRGWIRGELQAIGRKELIERRPDSVGVCYSLKCS